jgi:hypothetical protein
VLLGNGDGTFQTARNFATAGIIVSVAVGDFNGDGRPDLALHSVGGVSVLLGNGDGTFQDARNFLIAGSTSLQSMAVGDFNGDGRLDLVLTHYDGNVSVLLGNGDGTFQDARTFSAGSSAYAVVVGDFNGDGRLDLAGFFSGVRVLLGNGDGTFQTTNVSYFTGNDPTAVAVADFNGDGLPDLAVTSFISNDVTILLNDGHWSQPPRRPHIRLLPAGTAPPPTKPVASDFRAAETIALDVTAAGLVLHPQASVPAAVSSRWVIHADSAPPRAVASGRVGTDKPPLLAQTTLRGKAVAESPGLLELLAGNPHSVWLWDYSVEFR